jgi:hypothetical protein
MELTTLHLLFNVGLAIAWVAIADSGGWKLQLLRLPARRYCVWRQLPSRNLSAGFLVASTP